MIDAARAWVLERSPHAAHLLRTEDWVLKLAPDASPGLRLAGLTHDMERAYPDGSPRQEFARGWDDPLYRIAHCERSARIVGDFMRDHGAEEAFVREVVRLIVLHETGGSPEADVLQAADSLSFLETMAPVVAGWIVSGRIDEVQGRDRMRYAVDRIQHDRAREIARGLLAAAVADVDDILARSEVGLPP